MELWGKTSFSYKKAILLAENVSGSVAFKINLDQKWEDAKLFLMTNNDLEVLSHTKFGLIINGEIITPRIQCQTTPMGTRVVFDVPTNKLRPGDNFINLNIGNISASDIQFVTTENNGTLSISSVVASDIELKEICNGLRYSGKSALVDTLEINLSSIAVIDAIKLYNLSSNSINEVKFWVWENNYWIPINSQLSPKNCFTFPNGTPPTSKLMIQARPEYIESLLEVEVIGSEESQGPPKVTILDPSDNSILESSNFILQGYVDNPRAIVTVDSKNVLLNGHHFKIPLEFTTSDIKQTFTISATDECGLNGKTFVTYYKGEQGKPEITCNLPEIFYVGSSEIIINGTVRSAYNVKINSIQIPLQAGQYRTNLNLFEGENILQIEAQNSFGLSRLKRLVICDLNAPVIKLTKPEQKELTTSSDKLIIHGFCKDASLVDLFINKEPNNIHGDQFDSIVSLNPGKNNIVITAKDAVGHQSEIQIHITMKSPLNATSTSSPKEFFQSIVSKYSTPQIAQSQYSPYNSYFKNNIEDVSLANGSLSVEATDFTLLGREGMDLTIKRIYNSKLAQQEKIYESFRKRSFPIDTFGYDWSLNIPWIEYLKDVMYLRLPNGGLKKVSFTNGKFICHEGIHFTFEDHPEANSYVLIMKNGVKYVFDRGGKVIEQWSPSGQSKISYSYNGREISKIVDSVKREIVFGYKTVSSKRVINTIQVGDRVYRYEYNSPGLLKEYRDPLNRITSYSYINKNLNSGTEIFWIDYYGNDDVVGEYINYSLDLLKEITYPTTVKSTYDYNFINQYSWNNWIEEGWMIEDVLDITSSYYGYAITVKQHQVADKIELYDYETNNQFGSMEDGTFVPSYTFIDYVGVSCGEKTRRQINLHIYKDKNGYYGYDALGEYPKIDQYITSLPLQYIINYFDDEIYFEYDLATQCLKSEIHSPSGFEEAYSKKYKTDEWGNILEYSWVEYYGDNYVEQYLYHPHSTIKDLIDTKTVENFNPVTQQTTVITTTYTYNDAIGKPETIHISDETKILVTSYTYYSNGNLKTKTEPNGLITEYFYDINEAFLSRKTAYQVKDADGNAKNITSQYGYNQYGMKEWEMDSRGYVTWYLYDNLDRIVKVIFPDDNDVPFSTVNKFQTENPFQEYIFNDAQNTCDYYNENRQQTRFIFDGLGRLINKTEFLRDQSGSIREATTMYGRDEFGRITRVVSPLGVNTDTADAHTTWYEYDGLDRVTKIIFPGEEPGSKTNYAKIDYSIEDWWGTIETIIDENGGKVKISKDWNGNIFNVIQDCKYGDGIETYTWNYEYDSLGNTVYIKDPYGETTQEYDAWGHLVKIKKPTVTGSLVKPGTVDKNILRAPESVTPVIKFEYDLMGNLVTEISANGNIETGTNPDNYKIKYEYDQLNRLIQTSFKTTRKDVQTNTVQIKTSITKNYYDANGNKITTRIIMDPNDGSRDKVNEYVYSARNWLLSEKDPLGNITQYRYDPVGNKIAVIDPRNGENAPVIWYRFAENQLILEDPRSNKTFTTWYLYDDVNRLYRVVQPDTTPPVNPFAGMPSYDNPYTEITFDLVGNKLTERDPNGLILSYEYFPRNWLKSVSDPRGIRQFFKYDKVGNQTEVHTRVQDNVYMGTRRICDSLGRLRRIINPNMNIVDYEYDAFGKTTRIITNNGHPITTKYVYNKLGWLIETQNALSNKILYRYDLNGNQVAVISPNNLYQINLYDERDRLIERVDSLGRSEKYNYDLSGNVELVLDRRGTLRSYSYNKNNQLQQLSLKGKDTSVFTIQYQYDKAGNRLRVMDSCNPANTIIYNDGVYDPSNRINSMLWQFDGQTYRTEYSYNKAGQLTGIKYPEATEKIIYQYNQYNEIEEVKGFTKPKGIALNIDGTLKRILYNNGLSGSFAYDENRGLKELKVNNGSSDILDINFAYDKRRNITGIRNEVTKRNIVYNYDDVDQLIGYTQTGNVVESNPANGAAGLKENDFSGRNQLNFELDPSAIINLDYKSSSIGLDFGFEISDIKKIKLVPDSSHVGHRLSRESFELLTSADNSNYTYIPNEQWDFKKNSDGTMEFDLKNPVSARFFKVHVLYDERDEDFNAKYSASFLNELSKILLVYRAPSLSKDEYHYDANGNRSEKVLIVDGSSATVHYEYYPGSNLLKKDGKYAYVYDEAGNLVEKGNRYTESNGNIIFTTNGAGVEYWKFTYDLLNRLVKVDKNGLVVEYTYNPLGQRVSKCIDGVKTRYVFEGTEPILEKRSDGITRSYIYAVGKHLARVDGPIGSGTPVYYYHTDQIGSIKAITNQSGQMVWSAEYKPFGGIAIEQNTIEESHRFTGKEYDADVSLYYFNARWYDPELGRFVAEDPARDGTNWYVYGVNNPLINTDSTGMIHQDEDGNWDYDDWDYEWNYDYDCYNFWVYNDDFFSYGSNGGWWNDIAKLNAAWDFLGAVDFDSQNISGRRKWVTDKGYYIPYYESRRVQTIQGKMGIDVTGWYDDQTAIAVGTLQDMYGVKNARDSVFGLNSWRAMDSISNSQDHSGKYHEFYQEYNLRVAEARWREFLGDLLVNAAIFGGGKALLSKLLPEAAVTQTGNAINISTAGLSAEEAAAIRAYARGANQYIEQAGPQVIKSTAGQLRRDASAAAQIERLRASRAGQPYIGQVGHVPDTAISGSAIPPMGWLDMPGVSNQVVGGVLGSRVGQTIKVILVDGVKQ
ncbi:RHS repeat-associated protein [Hydrogenispora ethanolica]|uniref:RHS repeat-associated protein n=1 Tax=Hydrogenispora ethanolica TaxID=1082276 RepID=A0A4R1RW65_HYDET|nr:RHS repeat-associated protein [Hydrogenispora ethanolica]